MSTEIVNIKNKGNTLIKIILSIIGIALVAFTATQLSRTAQPALFPAKATAAREQ